MTATLPRPSRALPRLSLAVLTLLASACNLILDNREIEVTERVEAGPPAARPQDGGTAPVDGSGERRAEDAGRMDAMLPTLDARTPTPPMPPPVLLPAHCPTWSPPVLSADVSTPEQRYVLAPDYARAYARAIDDGEHPLRVCRANLMDAGYVYGKARLPVPENWGTCQYTVTSEDGGWTVGQITGSGFELMAELLGCHYELSAPIDVLRGERVPPHAVALGSERGGETVYACVAEVPLEPRPSPPSPVGGTHVGRAGSAPGAPCTFEFWGKARSATTFRVLVAKQP